MENKKPDCLPARVILYLAQCIAREYHLPRIDTERFQRVYDDPEGEGPYVPRSENGFHWLDRYYTRFSLASILFLIILMSGKFFRS